MLRLPTLPAFIPTPTTARDPKIAPSVPRTIFENNLMSTYADTLPDMYRRYVDDAFMIFKTRRDAQ